jgi:hypothetical protein
VRNSGDTALPFGRASTQPRHLRGGTSLVDEHEFFWVEITLLLHPLLTRRRYVGSLLFSRMRSLFFSVMCRLSKNRHKVPMPTLVPCAASDPARVAAKTMIVEEVERLHWRLWNGKAKNAQISIDRIRAVMRHFRGEHGQRKSIVPPRK